MTDAHGKGKGDADAHGKGDTDAHGEGKGDADAHGKGDADAHGEGKGDADAHGKGKGDENMLQGSTLPPRSCTSCGYKEANPEMVFCGRCGGDFVLKPSGREANSRAKAQEATLECVVCMDANKDTLLLPCMHLCVCGQCASALSHCPICRGEVDDKKRVFL